MIWSKDQEKVFFFYEPVYCINDFNTYEPHISHIINIHVYIYEPHISHMINIHLYIYKPLISQGNIPPNPWTHYTQGARIPAKKQMSSLSRVAASIIYFYFCWVELLLPSSTSHLKLLVPSSTSHPASNQRILGCNPAFRAEEDPPRNEIWANCLNK